VESVTMARRMGELLAASRTIPEMAPEEGGEVCANAPIAKRHNSPTDARKAEYRMASNPARYIDCSAAVGEMAGTHFHENP
ncbi:MAG TPA: hypothetical protein VH157_11965, partial [Bryobacteraceae bacterium]|nr:hypothetical protein [Bryobacteraceae bacterium]